MALCKDMKGESDKNMGVKISSLEGSLPCRSSFINQRCLLLHFIAFILCAVVLRDSDVTSWLHLSSVFHKTLGNPLSESFI